MHASDDYWTEMLYLPRGLLCCNKRRCICVMCTYSVFIIEWKTRNLCYGSTHILGELFGPFFLLYKKKYWWLEIPIHSYQQPATTQQIHHACGIKTRHGSIQTCTRAGKVPMRYRIAFPSQPCVRPTFIAHGNFEESWNLINFPNI